MQVCGLIELVHSLHFFITWANILCFLILNPPVGCTTKRAAVVDGLMTGNICCLLKWQQHIFWSTPNVPKSLLGNKACIPERILFIELTELKTTCVILAYHWRIMHLLLFLTCHRAQTVPAWRGFVRPGLPITQQQIVLQTHSHMVWPAN